MGAQFSAQGLPNATPGVHCAVRSIMRSASNAISWYESPTWKPELGSPIASCSCESNLASPRTRVNERYRDLLPIDDLLHGFRIADYPFANDAPIYLATTLLPVGQGFWLKPRALSQVSAAQQVLGAAFQRISAHEYQKFAS